MKMERNDPTHAGFTPPATVTARLSGNEVEALCLKAARGAGLSWGLAEEAGYAARWLYARGLDGPGALLAHLEKAAGAATDLALTDGALRNRNAGPLCPIAVGAALSDLAAVSSDCVRAGPVDRPLLILPFVHQIAAASDRPMVLEFSNVSVSASAAGDVAGELSALASAEVAEIAIAPGFEAPAVAASRGFAAPTRDTIARLNDLAMLTYVPASAASRADAGSTDGDND